MLLSELAGALLLLVIAWILVLKNQLWQHWLRRRYQSALDQVVGAGGLVESRGWKARIGARGRRDGVRLHGASAHGRPHGRLVRARDAL